jgi:cellulose synthase/poly-beta-1,6-N-acetylglucosamine synthase-like glycosyltransferase
MMVGIAICWLMFLPLAIFWGVWLLLILAGAAAPRKTVDVGSDKTGAPSDNQRRVRIDILIPAHDEELMLPRTLESLLAQHGNARGGLLVIADHCTDCTAEIAQAAGAAVLERDSGPRGKPAALRDGLAFLSARPERGDAVMIVDADCVCSPNLLDLAAAALLQRKPRQPVVLQAAYSMQSSDCDVAPSAGGNNLAKSMSVGFGLKNVIRPRGMARLGLPTQLFGSGMVFSYDALHHVAFADHLTEDLQMSQQLIAAGIYPQFLAGATVISPAPADTAALTKQRQRWEGGQFHTWATLPGLGARLLARGRIRGLISLLDWSAPPLAMGLLAWAFLTLIVVIFTVVFHLVSPIGLLGAALCLLLISGYLVIGLLALGGVRALLATGLGAPRFLWWKVRLYAGMATGQRSRTWERTARTTGEGS